ncbi:MAG TPA: Ig-like domain-containing protein [Gammaproteobacteria bacterium]|nr:Ig-like domain-containing protein [Gammaproteobacteria bacterium]
MRRFSGLVRQGCRLLALAALSLSPFFAVSSRAATTPAPGGFMESDTVTVTRPLLDATTISGFLPQRGFFTFPAPYNTQGIRITNSGDCGGQDCVDMTYSYWRNMSNSAGSNTMYIFVGLDRNRGGQGPTLFSYDKTTDALTEVGPMFASSSPYSWNSAEGWYFSYGMPTKIYLQSGSKLMRYDVVTKAMETVFDSTTAYPGTVIHQTNSSNDDDVHSATLKDASTYAVMGCIAYKVSTQHFYYYPAQGTFDECQIDKSGRYLDIKEKLPSDPCTSCDEDDVIEDLQTGTQTVLYDQAGAGGHSDLGYGTMVASDNWNNYANAWRLWDLSAPFPAVQGQGGATNLLGGLPQGGLLYHDNTWGVFAPSHISYANANAATPVSQQYACGGSTSATGTSYGNEIVCFMLNSSVAAASEQRLVVAPVMSDLSATGGDATCPSCTAYAKDPKGNIDPTGQYFFWISNMGGSRMDAFVVKIPYQVMTGGSGSSLTTASGGDTTPPSVSITAPLASAQLSGTVSVSAAATDNVGVTGVQFLLDGADLGAEITQAPYSFSWNTSNVKAGTHLLTAVARDAAGNSATAASVSVTTYAAQAPVLRNIAVTIRSTSATVSWNTNQPATGQVAYGLTSNYGHMSTLNSTLLTAHSIVLTGLVAGTVYHYHIISRDAAGLATVSIDLQFKTTLTGSTTTIVSGQTQAVSSSATPANAVGSGSITCLELAMLMCLSRYRRRQAG